jgi:hypothetical protein
MIDKRDRVWIRGFAENSWPNGLSPIWHIFESEGRYMGAAFVPLEYVYDIGENGIMGSVLESDGTERIGVVGLPNLDEDRGSGPKAKSGLPE